MTGASRRTGAPIVSLTMLLCGWIALRIVLWESPFPAVPVPEFLAEAGNISDDQAFRGPILPPPEFGGDFAVNAFQSSGLPQQNAWSSPYQLSGTFSIAKAPVAIPATERKKGSPTQTLDRTMPPSAGFAIGTVRMARSASASASTTAANISRWRLDTYALYRPGTGATARQGNSLPRYGSSQAAAILRYDLAPISPHRPQLYARLTQAFADPRETEGAVGASIRPVPAIPVRAMAEARLQRAAGETRLRPAVLAVTEFPPVALPLKTQIEMYGQAGYVGGEFATPFADGQVCVTRRLSDTGGGVLRIGAGAWGGAQRGAARLDIGPTASIAIPLGDAAARISLDYRQRVAGQAEPGSGVALTVSTGF